MFAAEGGRPKSLPEEEIACDVWARSFLTDKLAAYAELVDHDYESVLVKRSMGIALAAIIIRAITPAYAHWGAADYPPLGERIEALIGATSLPDASHFWIFTACLMVGAMRQDRVPLDLVPASPRELVEALIATLR